LPALLVTFISANDNTIEGLPAAMTLAMTKYSFHVINRVGRSPQDPAIDRQLVKREVQSSVPLCTARRGEPVLHVSRITLFFSCTRDTLESFEALACNVLSVALFCVLLLERFYGGNGYKSTPDCVYAGLVRDQSGM